MFGMTTPAAASSTYEVSITLSGTTCDANTTVTASASSLQVATGDIVRVTVTNNVTGKDCGVGLSPTAGGNLLGWIFSPNSSPVDLSGSPSFFLTATTGSQIAKDFQVGTVEATVSVADDPGEAFDPILTITFGTLDEPSGPPDLLQQFALTPDEDCISVPAEIDLFNVPRDGGWSKSWAQWPNEGAGSFVCTRQVMYQPSTGTWVPRTSS